jgi:proteinaceous RNase P
MVEKLIKIGNLYSHKVHINYYTYSYSTNSYKKNSTRLKYEKNKNLIEKNVIDRIKKAAKDANIKKASHLFLDMVEKSKNIGTDTISSILHLISGGDEWVSLLRNPNVKVPASLDQILQLAYEYSEESMVMTEMTFTTLARVSSLKGNCDIAVQLASNVRSINHQKPRIRTFMPSLKGFVLTGAYQRAQHLCRSLRTLDLEINEEEHALLLESCVESTEKLNIISILSHMSAEIPSTKMTTIAIIKHCFNAQISQQLLPKGFTTWIVSKSESTDEGFLDGLRLGRFDLCKNEWNIFAERIAKIAKSKEKHQRSFKRFIAWLNQQEPYEIIIDGANVAMFGQSSRAGLFQFKQIDRVVKALEERYPNKRILVILHQRRLNCVEAESPESLNIIKKLVNNAQVYFTPVGSNDDWYWIYACVKAGCDGLLVSNDEMLDHFFSMLSPNFFLKWKQQHQVRYIFTPYSSLNFEYPKKYTSCIQRLPGGAWVFPIANEDNVFILARPSKVNIEQ